MSGNNILKTIIEHKQQSISFRKSQLPIEELDAIIRGGELIALRSFHQALQQRLIIDRIAIIAELKKASPSKGLLCKHYDPAMIAQRYTQHHATCLSVLTETDFFLGCDQDLITAKANSTLPILRKDFIVDSYQIYESRYIGADCILLIVAALSPQQLQDLYGLATELGLDVIIEVHNEEELAIAVSTCAKLIGINNRNLKTFEVDLNNTISLAQYIPKDRIVICESGIKSRSDLIFMLEHHIHTFLIGELLVGSDSPGLVLKDLLGK